MAAPPRILLVGDSISMGYGPLVAERLAGRAVVTHNPGNAGDSDHTAAGLAQWIEQARPDILHINCGLHDVKVDRATGAWQVPLERYRRNLRRIVELLGGSGIAAMWASTTPVVESRHAARKPFDRFNRDIDACNAAAAAIMRQAGIPLVHLHRAVVNAAPEALLDADGVHFTPGGYALLADVVVDALTERIGP